MFLIYHTYPLSNTLAAVIISSLILPEENPIALISSRRRSFFTQSSQYIIAFFSLRHIAVECTPGMLTRASESLFEQSLQPIPLIFIVFFIFYSIKLFGFFRYFLYNLNAFRTTKSELMLIAPAAAIGERLTPKRL